MLKVFASALPLFLLAFAAGCGGGGQSGPNNALPLSSLNAGSLTTDSQRAQLQGSLRVASQVGTTFSDTFQNDALGGSAAGWTVNSGKWSVCEPPAATHEYCQRSWDAAFTTPSISQSSWTNYEVDASMLLGSSGGGIGLVFRMKDVNHYYQFEIRSDLATANESWDVSRYDGSWHRLMGGAFTATINKAVAARIVVSGSSIVAYIGSTRLGAATDDSYATGGIGLRTFLSTSSTFDNIAVTSLGGSSPSPTNAPSSSPTTAPRSSTAFKYSNGCQINAPGDYYTINYANAAVDPNSAAIISSITSVYDTGFVQDDREYALVAKTKSSSTMPTKEKTSYHFSPNPAPYSRGDYIEPEGDAHYFAIIANGTAACTAYEYYSASASGSYLAVYDGAAFNTVTRSFVPTSGQPHGTSGYKPPTGSGLDYLPSTIKQEEIAAGSINHVMDFTDSPGANCNCYIAPATSDEEITYRGSSQHRLPYGGHIRLKPGYFDATASAQCAVVLTALKQYGAILRDTDGSNYTNNNKLDMLGAIGTTSGMGSYDFGCLSKLRFAEFDVLTVGATKTN